MGRTNETATTLRVKFALFLASCFRLISSFVWTRVDPLKVKDKTTGQYLDVGNLEFEGGYLFSQGVVTWECAFLLYFWLKETHPKYRIAWRFFFVAAFYELIRQYFLDPYKYSVWEYGGVAIAVAAELIMYAILLKKNKI